MKTMNWQELIEVDIRYIVQSLTFPTTLLKLGKAERYLVAQCTLLVHENTF